MPSCVVSYWNLAGKLDSPSLLVVDYGYVSYRRDFHPIASDGLHFK
jgi:hypothetical protein